MRAHRSDLKTIDYETNTFYRVRRYGKYAVVLVAEAPKNLIKYDMWGYDKKTHGVLNAKPVRVVGNNINPRAWATRLPQPPAEAMLLGDVEEDSLFFRDDSTYRMVNEHTFDGAIVAMLLHHTRHPVDACVVREPMMNITLRLRAPGYCALLAAIDPQYKRDDTPPLYVRLRSEARSA